MKFTNSLSMLSAGTLLTLLISLNTAVAADSFRQPPPIPQEAYTACESLSENASCTISGRNGESMSGVCVAPPEQSESALSCRPDKMGNKGERPPAPPSNR